MMQKYSHTKIYTLLLSIALLAACSSSDALTGGSTTDHPNGAIELSAGIVEGGSALVTRAGAEDNHGKHLTLTENTKLALRVSGTWTGHTPSPVVQTTTATVGSETSPDSKHNTLGCSPTLYWDDYGTADPANYNDANKADDSNSAYGRGVGLTIYGVAIDGKKDAAPAVSDWNALPWTLSNNQAANNEKPADKDLLISNNVQGTKVTDKELDTGNYKFDEKDYGKLLEFRHALSKITVNLKAGDGFDGAFGSTTVQLTSNEGTPNDATAWPIITGKVNVANGSVDIASAGQGTHSAITMYHNTSATLPTGYHAVHEALVMPGSAFKKDAIIARINADGNIYYVNSTKIREAINAEAHNTDDPTVAGKNYVINVIVNKTEIEVTATVVDWTTVNAAEVAPKIKIDVDYGVPGTAVNVNKFSFYRSLSLNDGYSEGDSYKINGYYRRAAELNRSGDTWTMSPQRYWSNHNQHFQFRLVWPNTTTAKKEGDNENVDPDRPGEYVQKWRPHVEDKTYGTTNYQVIEIWNDPFQDVDPNKTDISSVEGNIYHPYPSNLAIARPDVGENEECTNNEPGHTRTNLYSGGICATEGKINLTFRFVMSQVEVQLTTTSTSSSAVRLDDAKVELVNAYTHGYVMLGDRTVKPDGEQTTDELDFWKKETVGGTDTRFFRSAIVPQELTFSEAQASGNLKFKITITNGDGTKDVYYADVEPILKSDASGKVAPNGKWESGVRYVYHLNVSKTLIKATATLANWQTVEASQEIWF